MMFDVMLIAAGIAFLYLLEHVPYFLRCREVSRLQIENERLDVYLELQSLCLNSSFKGGEPAHDILISLSERYPTLPLWHVTKVIFSSRYRERFESFGRKIERDIDNMPINARKLVDRLRAIDVKLVFIKQPVVFCILFMFIFFEVILKSKEKRMADTESVMTELLVQRENRCTLAA